MACSWRVSELLEHPKIQTIPKDLIEQITRGEDETILVALSKAALYSDLTDDILSLFENEIVEIIARWQSLQDHFAITVALAKSLLHSSCAAVQAVSFFEVALGHGDFLCVVASNEVSLETVPEERLCRLLLAVIRFLYHDYAMFRKYITPPKLYHFLSYPYASVQYLVIRILSLYLRSADTASNAAMKNFIGEKEIYGEWEGHIIDYRFLDLWEETRLEKVTNRIQMCKERRDTNAIDYVAKWETKPPISSETFVNIYGIKLPKCLSATTTEHCGIIIPTSTTIKNCRRIANAILDKRPLILSGVAGTAKTFLLKYITCQVQNVDKLVIIQLNEFTDVKSLVGFYSSDPQHAGLKWKPGLLTKAISEGHWLIIEDFERVRPEVLSLFLSVIEHKILNVLSTGEQVIVSPTFQLFALCRSDISVLLRNLNITQLANASRWNVVYLDPLTRSDLASIVDGLYPNFQLLTNHIIETYFSLKATEEDDNRFDKKASSSSRIISPKDLLKWCRRIAKIVTDVHPLTDSDISKIFFDAVDIFTEHIADDEKRKGMTHTIARCLCINFKRRDYLLYDRIIEFAALNSFQPTLSIGRTAMIINTAHNEKSDQGSNSVYSLSKRNLTLLEQLTLAINMQEPILVVGETGTGKTATIQFLARKTNNVIKVINLSQQSEPGDLIGGLKPVNVGKLVTLMSNNFENIFHSIYPIGSNKKFYEILSRSLAKNRWKRVVLLWKEAIKVVTTSKTSTAKEHQELTDDSTSRKKRKINNVLSTEHEGAIREFQQQLEYLESQLSLKKSSLAFQFQEGVLLKAMREGYWVLLDEINLAPSETLDCIFSILKSSSRTMPSLILQEGGPVEHMHAHQGFRLLAAMNPANELGRANLSPGLRSHFTEIFFKSPDNDPASLQQIVEEYLSSISSGLLYTPLIIDLYNEIKIMVKDGLLLSGTGKRPEYCLRTLTRALLFILRISSFCNLRRALYESFTLGFLTPLDRKSSDLLENILAIRIFGHQSNKVAELCQDLHPPSNNKDYINEGKFWLLRGSYCSNKQEGYVITSHVRYNLNNLCRAVLACQFPVLVEGPTATGKTSMIEYLARRTHHKTIRINNHEHTDIQEYLGRYIPVEDGRLHFKEGLLVQAMRLGQWVILDELNLAPSEVLEALNRLLDDNRELLIPETGEVVTPHEHFMLFATQNPAGSYGGRKLLSLPFRTRFLDIYFDDIPLDELSTILYERTKVPMSWSRRIASVYTEISKVRSKDYIYQQQSLVTLRDLFRWALRKASTLQELAESGYLLLAERIRQPEERLLIKSAIESIFGFQGPLITIDDSNLYNKHFMLESECRKGLLKSSSLVWTEAMKRLYVLIKHALENDEPVLLVGETGSGKTSVCATFADLYNKQLFTVNAHQNIESGDLIGSHRPVRSKDNIEIALFAQVLEVLVKHNYQPNNLREALEIYDALPPTVFQDIAKDTKRSIKLNRDKLMKLFDWVDGSLVQAMKQGQFFLLDEISLADDSVLERLNSVLEPEGTLLLAEKGDNDSLIKKKNGFQFFATMNPGGDYGKRELTPALRNRFTEIWVPSSSDFADLVKIAENVLNSSYAAYAINIVAFAQWFTKRYNVTRSHSLSIRDIVAWATFLNNFSSVDKTLALTHGAAIVYIDAVGAEPGVGSYTATGNVREERARCMRKLAEIIKSEVPHIYDRSYPLVIWPSSVAIGPFEVSRKGGNISNYKQSEFSLQAPTARQNAMRVIRALKLAKPILLEGDPGVGKTALVAAISSLTSNPLVRVNLSEETDIIDLLGSDYPADNEELGNFVWKDAPVLRAMKLGYWVLLDEINLASQSVLEGLNSCIDHRGECYVPELNRKFSCHRDFRLFATQNPHRHGHGRKGLPQAFVNRFTVVYVDHYDERDQFIICKDLFPHIDHQILSDMINFASVVEKAIAKENSLELKGGPWDFNLRDILRWLSLIDMSRKARGLVIPEDFIDTIFLNRFPDVSIQEKVKELYSGLHPNSTLTNRCQMNISKTSFQVGQAITNRNLVIDYISQRQYSIKGDRSMLQYESILLAIEMAWPVILSGLGGSGKSTMIETIAAITGAELCTISMNADTDISELIGGLEQSNTHRELRNLLREMYRILQNHCVKLLSNNLRSSDLATALDILQALDLTQVDISNVNIMYLRDLLKEIKIPEKTGLFDKSLRSMEVIIEERNTQKQNNFSWVDGPLIHALERGSWVVLDNANSSSPSVLDRLNSLLEIGGSLCINENCTADGESRVIVPHPDFRLFLTMDPNKGELSRAIRNRSVEVCILRDEADSEHFSLRSDHRVHLTQSSLYRFRNMKSLCQKFACGIIRENPVQIAVNNLCHEDLLSLESFKVQISEGLLGDVDNMLIKEILEKVDSQVKCQKEWKWQNINERILQHNESSNSAEHIMKARPLLLLHPLNNVIIAASKDSVRREMEVYGFLYDICTEIFSLWELSTIELDMQLDAPLESDFETRTVEKPFRSKLKTVLQISLKYLLDHSKSAIGSFSLQTPDLRMFQSLMNLVLYIKQVMLPTRVDQVSFEAFRIFFLQYLELLKSTEYERKHYLQLIEDLNSTMSSGAPQIGLSTYLMWNHYKGFLISDMEQFSLLTTLMNFASIYDDSKWRLPISALNLLGEIGDKIVHYARKLIYNNDLTSTSIHHLQHAIKRLDYGCLSSTKLKPIFSSEFHYLHKLLVLSPELLHLLPFSCLSLVRFFGITSIKELIKDCLFETRFGSLDRVPSRLLNRSQVIDSRSTAKWLIMLLHKVEDMKNLRLERHQWLEQEAKALGQSISVLQGKIAKDHYKSMLEDLKDNLVHLLTVHESFFERTSYKGIPGIVAINGEVDNQWQFNFKHKTPPSNYFRKVCHYVLRPIVELYYGNPISNQKQMISLAIGWACLGVACVKLYVPDAPTDPALLVTYMKDFLANVKLYRNRKLSHARQCEPVTGAITTLSMKFFVDQITGYPFDMTNIEKRRKAYRSKESDFSTIDSIFKSSLLLIDRFVLHQMVDLKCLKNPLLLENVEELLERIAKEATLYNDLKAPLISFLNCLRIGCLISAGIESREVKQSYISSILSQVPLLGAKPATWYINESSDLPIFGNENVVISLFSLRSLTVRLSTVDIKHISSWMKENIKLLFDRLSEYRKSRANLLRSNIKKGSSLYQYRSQDDVRKDDNPNSELLQLQHDHTNMTHPIDQSKLTTPDLFAVSVANIHLDMFMQSRQSKDLLKELFQETNSAIMQLNITENGYSVPASIERELSVLAILSLRGTLSKGGVISSEFENNKFHDIKGFHEAKKLISIARDIFDHFWKLAESSFENKDDIVEIVQRVRSILSSQICESLVTFLDMAEGLYELLLLWQEKNAKSDIISSFILALRDLICTWKMMEVKSWKSIIEAEEMNCIFNAKSWWFLLYDNIIVGSRKAVEEETVDSFIKILLVTVEKFLSSAPCGQFDQRLSMTKSLARHLAFLYPEVSALSRISVCIMNIANFYTHFKPEIEQASKSIRSALTKDVSEITQLITWKDQDVETLKECIPTARTRVIRVVEKYREHLTEPIESLLAHRESQSHGIKQLEVPQKAQVLIDPEPIQSCEAIIPGWQERKLPYRDVSTTLELMNRIAVMRNCALDRSIYLNNVAITLQSTAQSLHQTSSARTGIKVGAIVEGKKRILLDIVKGMRNLGFRQRLNRNVLLSQGSSLEILYNMSHSFDINDATLQQWEGAKRCFFEIVQNISPAKKALSKHTSNIANFSALQFIRYYGDVICLLKRQVSSIMDYMSVHSDLRVLILSLKPIISGEDELCAASRQRMHFEKSYLLAELKLLPALISQIVEIIAAQNYFFERQDDLISELGTWAKKISSLLKTVNGFSIAFEKVYTKKYEEISGKAWSLLMQFDTDLQQWQCSYPTLELVFSEIREWVAHICNAQDASRAQFSISKNTVTASIFNVLDLILGSIQDVRSQLRTLNSVSENTIRLWEVNKRTFTILDAFRPRAIEQNLRHIMKSLALADHEDNDCYASANALLRTLGPIIEQYYYLFSHFVSQCISLHYSASHFGHVILTTFISLCDESSWSFNDTNMKCDYSSDVKDDKIGLGDNSTGDSSIDDSQMPRNDNETNSVDRSESQINHQGIKPGDAPEVDEDSLNEIETNSDRSVDSDDYAKGHGEEVEEKIEDTGPSAVEEKVWSTENLNKSPEAADSQNEALEDLESKVKMQSVEDETSTKNESIDVQNPDKGIPEEVHSTNCTVDGGTGRDDSYNSEIDSVIPSSESSFAGDQISLSDEQQPQMSTKERDDERTSSENALDNLTDLRSNLMTEDISSSSSNDNDDMTSNIGVEEREDDLGKMVTSPKEDSYTPNTEVEPKNIGEHGTAYQEPENQGSLGTDPILEENLDISALQIKLNDSDCTNQTTDLNQSNKYSDQLGDSDSYKYPLKGSKERKSDLSKSQGCKTKQCFRKETISSEGPSASKEIQDLDLKQARVQHDSSENDTYHAQALSSLDENVTKQGEISEEVGDMVEDINIIPKEKVKYDTFNDAKGVEDGTVNRNMKYYPENNDMKSISDSIGDLDLLQKYDDERVLNGLSTIKIESEDTSERQIESRSNLPDIMKTTQSLSQLLAEQLRLILEPTKSSRFRGDYRTGKRLNLRRIIPYIASDGKRDKIWMRRGVPSRRAYQVILALDDSKSMAENGSDRPALQSLTIIAKALRLVEAGDLCVIAFGEHVKIALDFGSANNNDTNLLINQNFTFAQPKTDVLKLLKATLSHLRVARMRISSSESHLWQLQMIISDGICEDHEAIHRLLCQAEEERVMVVFIIMDIQSKGNADDLPIQQQSILDLQTAAFIADGEDEMVLRRRRYMNSFPFKWYLLVRGVEELPSILTSALKQWFAEISSYDS